MRRIYFLTVYLLAPLYCAALLWRGTRERGYLAAFGERFGLGPRLAGESIWIHAASAGEVQAAAPLVRALCRRSAARTVVVTTVTPAGKARAHKLLEGERVSVRFLPLDLPGSVRGFLDRVRPRIALVVETELWPSLFRECGRRGIPLVLASARLSERSMRRYRALRSLFADALANCTLLATQTEADARRFEALGAPAERTRVIGNLKFDLELPAELERTAQSLRRQLAPTRAVWVAGSTHDGEEGAALDAHARIRLAHPDALLVLAPRHPPRFDAVAALLERRAVRFIRRSAAHPCAPDAEVLLLDSLGELIEFYAAADVVFVGGSLAPVGGHNLLEPAALGKPILTGPHVFDNAEIAGLLRARGALETVRDAQELARAVSTLLAHPQLRAQRGTAARAVATENRGTLARLLALLEPRLEEPLPPAAAAR